MNKGKWTKGMKAFRADPISHYKASIARRQQQIERRNRLNEADKLAIERLEYLIEREEMKKDG